MFAPPPNYGQPIDPYQRGLQQQQNPFQQQQNPFQQQSQQNPFQQQQWQNLTQQAQQPKAGLIDKELEEQQMELSSEKTTADKAAAEPEPEAPAKKKGGCVIS
jgi:hypothetical protein